MYNRYIPDDTSYTRVEQEPSAPHRMDQERPAGQNHRPGGPSQGPGNRPQPGHPQPGQQGGYSMGGFKLPSFLNGKDGLSALLGGREGGGLSALLKSLHLDNIDTGDILLLLIVLYLLVEGDDLELVIALGLVLIMGLGEDEEKAESE